MAASRSVERQQFRRPSAARRPDRPRKSHWTARSAPSGMPGHLGQRHLPRARPRSSSGLLHPADGPRPGVLNGANSNYQRSRSSKPTAGRYFIRSSGEQQREPFGVQPPGRKRQRVQRAAVQPLRVVHNDQQRQILGQESASRVSTARPVSSSIGRDRVRGQRERSKQRLRLPVRQPRHPVKHRPQQLVQPGECQVLPRSRRPTDNTHIPADLRLPVPPRPAGLSCPCLPRRATAAPGCLPVIYPRAGAPRDSSPCHPMNPLSVANSDNPSRRLRPISAQINHHFGSGSWCS